VQFQGEEISRLARGFLSEGYAHSGCEIDAEFLEFCMKAEFDCTKSTQSFSRKVKMPKHDE